MKLDKAITTGALLDTLGISEKRQRRNFSSQLYNWAKNIEQKRKSGNVTPLSAKFRYGIHYVKFGQSILWFPAGVELATELYKRKHHEHGKEKPDIP